MWLEKGGGVGIGVHPGGAAGSGRLESSSSHLEMKSQEARASQSVLVWVPADMKKCCGFDQTV